MYPVGIHFGIVQLVMTIAVLLMRTKYGDLTKEIYLGQVILLNGIGNAGVFLILYPFYKRDMHLRQRFQVIEEKNQTPFRMLDGCFLLFIGAAFALIVNLSLSIFGEIIQMEEYADNMNSLTAGKNFYVLLFFIGILGPLTEELVFRWMIFLRLRDSFSTVTAAVVSGLLFGLYHGNLTQFVYAAILGIVFALMVEWTGSIWSSFFLHVGANIWSLILSEYGQQIILQIGGFQVALYLVLFLLILFTGTSFYYQIGKGKARRV